MRKTPTKFNFSKTTKQLTAANLTKSAQWAGWINEGIMSSKFPNYKISAKLKGLTYPDVGKACYWIDTINFNWVFSPTIFVAKEYKRGSCKYNTVINHERQHVKIDIAILKKYRDKIKNNLRKQALYPITSGLVNSNAKVNLLKKVEDDLAPLIERMVKERTIEQGKIDTVEEYTKLGNMCK
ncbi:MAG: hypothetical protein N4A43_01515 [Alphaproteobacteria bacterium]|jgi:hypothetical protein|nr:hypothetical protein [Alphaproteobacteria bacterium]